MYRGYQDTRWVLDARRIVPPGRESAAGMALVDGQMLAAMLRRVTTDRVVFGLAPYRTPRPRELTELQRTADGYGDYLGLGAMLDAS